MKSDKFEVWTYIFCHFPEKFPCSCGKKAHHAADSACSTDSPPPGRGTQDVFQTLVFNSKRALPTVLRVAFWKSNLLIHSSEIHRYQTMMNRHQTVSISLQKCFSGKSIPASAKCSLPRTSSRTPEMKGQW